MDFIMSQSFVRLEARVPFVEQLEVVRLLPKMLRVYILGDEGEQIIVRKKAEDPSFLEVLNVPDRERVVCFAHGLFLGLLAGARIEQAYVHIWSQMTRQYP